jgi:hypothetical protein
MHVYYTPTQPVATCQVESARGTTPERESPSQQRSDTS